MRNAIKTAAILIGLAALAACGREDSDQNIAIDNQAAAPADIEALPADESSATASEDLADGTIEANDAAAANQTNSY